LWLVTAFVCGYVIMSLELAAFRLYAPYFGYALHVWGGMIAVVMAALAAGYAGGGWLADRSRSDLPLFLAILFSAIYQSLILFVAPRLLATLSTAGELTGSLVATLVVFAAPVATLAAAGPFVTRLLARGDRVGATAGNVSALSTVGSIAGVLVTSFWIVPTFGTRAALLIACGATALQAMAGLATAKRWWAAAGFVAAAPLLWPRPLWQPWPGTVFLDESPYNLIRVVDQKSERTLVLNDGIGVQTIRDADVTSSAYYYDDFGLAALLTPGRRMLVLGMGGGQTIEATRRIAAEVRVDAVEIDPEVVNAAERFFDLRRRPGLLDVYLADARPWLASHAGQYDIVQLDLYHGGPYVPFYLTTFEFYRSVREHLSNDGVVVLNVFDAGRNHAILASTVATLRQVFPTVLGFEHGQGTWIFYAFASVRSDEAVRSEMAAATNLPTRVIVAAARAAAALREFQPDATASVFTDDRAPIEQMTRRMIREFRATIR
jgi:spermidine synthase